MKFEHILFKVRFKIVLNDFYNILSTKYLASPRYLNLPDTRRRINTKSLLHLRAPSLAFHQSVRSLSWSRRNIFPGKNRRHCPRAITDKDPVGRDPLP